MSLLTDPIFTTSDGTRASLPQLFAAMSKGEVKGFPALRPHQRPAWHMFLVQLGALATWTARHDKLPDDAAAWASALRGLTPNHLNDEPWQLVVEDRSKPAFLQPPDPGNLKWFPVPTPDALDLLITSRNHDLKKAVARRATAEDWVFALVSLQTCEGYGGPKNYGIARMNRGFSSRPMLGLAPGAKRGDLSVDPSAWWRRDAHQLFASRTPGDNLPIGVIGGPGLLWCLEWPEADQLDIRQLDPWFIEVCRRVRLTKSDEGLRAKRAFSKAARIQAKAFKGNVGDPWAPVHKSEAEALTLGGGDFDYARLCDLLFSGEWTVPQLASAVSGDTGDMLLVAETLSRGRGKTEGFKSRVINVPGNVLPLFSSDTASSLSKAQMKEIKAFDKALRDALALAAASGDRVKLDQEIKKNEKNKQKKNRFYAHAAHARTQFDRVADRVFFPGLWRRLAVSGQSPAGEFEAKRTFLVSLKQSAEAVLETALPSMPYAAIYRPRAEARARRAFRTTLRRSDACTELFIKEETDVAA